MDLKSEKGNIVSTARWVGYGLVDALANDFFDMSKLKDDAGFISEHGRLMLHLIQLRFTAEPNHPHKTQLLQNIDPKFGLLGFTLEILRVEADLASNHKHHIAMFVGQIMEELAEVGVGHKSLTPIKRTVDDFVEFATRPFYQPTRSPVAPNSRVGLNNIDHKMKPHDHGLAEKAGKDSAGDVLVPQASVKEPIGDGAEEAAIRESIEDLRELYGNLLFDRDEDDKEEPKTESIDELKARYGEHYGASRSGKPSQEPQPESIDELRARYGEHYGTSRSSEPSEVEQRGNERERSWDHSRADSNKVDVSSAGDNDVGVEITGKEESESPVQAQKIQEADSKNSEENDQNDSDNHSSTAKQVDEKNSQSTTFFGPFLFVLGLLVAGGYMINQEPSEVQVDGDYYHGDDADFLITPDDQLKGLWLAMRDKRWSERALLLWRWVKEQPEAVQSGYWFPTARIDFDANSKYLGFIDRETSWLFEEGNRPLWILLPNPTERTVRGFSFWVSSNCEDKGAEKSYFGVTDISIKAGSVEVISLEQSNSQSIERDVKCLVVSGLDH